MVSRKSTNGLSSSDQSVSTYAVEAAGLDAIQEQLRNIYGWGCPQYKPNLMARGIGLRMAKHAIASHHVYARYLAENPAEVELLFKELLIGVTRFFRDPDAFKVLQQTILPQMFTKEIYNKVYRVWVAGCASGEEAYSLAIVLNELLRQTQQNVAIQICATDLDIDSIEQARAGLYSAEITADTAPERLSCFFTPTGSGYRVKQFIREQVAFIPHDVIHDPPFNAIDLISCRNLMIYLRPEVQDNLLTSFHAALKPDGLLFLAPTESIGNHVDLFAPLNHEWKLYRRI